MKASSLSFQAGVVLLVIGVIWGIQMGISKDHAAMPAHAHLNLLGFVSLFLFSNLLSPSPLAGPAPNCPCADRNLDCGRPLPMIIGVGLVHTGREAGEPFAAIGSLIVLAGVLMFGWQVYLCERGIAAEPNAIAPAE